MSTYGANEIWTFYELLLLKIMGNLISVYVDASEMCNNLAFQLGTSNDVMKQWTIKVDFTNNIFFTY